MNSDIISSSIVYRKEMALKLVIYTIICLLLLFIANNFFNNQLLSIIFLLIVIAPVFFMKSVIKNYTRDVKIEFKEKFFSIVISGSDNAKDTSSEFYLKDIKSYNIQFPNRKFSSIKFNFKVGKSIEYSFFQIKQKDEQIGSEKIINSFNSFIKDYNQNTTGTEKIILKPAFFASMTGLFFIMGLCFLFFIAALLHLFYQVKTLPVTLFLGLALIVQLFIKRRTDINIFKKMS